MKSFSDMTIGARIFVNHEAYEKKSSRTAYKLEWNHHTLVIELDNGGLIIQQF